MEKLLKEVTKLLNSLYNTNKWESAIRALYLYEMSDSHLANTLILLHNNRKAAKELGIKCPDVNGKHPKEWIKLLKLEYLRRDLKAKHELDLTLKLSKKATKLLKKFKLG